MEAECRGPPCNQSKGDDSQASDEAEGDDPLIPYRINPWTYKCDSDDKMGGCKPIGSIGKKGVDSSSSLYAFIHPLNPGDEMRRFREGMQRLRP